MIGKIYTWGVGEQGQLGRKIMPRHVVDSSLTPRTINFRPYKLSSRFSAAFAGGYHTFLVHETGSVYSFGLNNYGQLGVGGTEEAVQPEPVLGLDGKIKVSDIRGGEHHSLALDTNGNVWVWGRGDSGQLGLGNVENTEEPAKLSDLSHINHIAAGGAFCLAVNQQGSVYGWGYGEMGQLANGSEDESSPSQFPLKERKVLDASAGGQHTLLLLNFKE
jgi:regulator of chromosome condensation